MSGAAERVVMRRAEGNPINVLVVDDETVLAEMVSMALRYEGWKITPPPTASRLLLRRAPPAPTWWCST